MYAGSFQVFQVRTLKAAAAVKEFVVYFFFIDHTKTLSSVVCNAKKKERVKENKL